MGILKHGHNKRSGSSPEYVTWCNIKYRCNNPNYREYHLYGGRGIKISEAWDQSFEQFLIDMGTRPSKEHSIDRIDNNGNYENGNCRWATEKEQQRNRRSNRWIELDGKRMILKEWADQLKTTPSTILKMMEKKPFNNIVDYYQNHRRKPRLK